MRREGSPTERKGVHHHAKVIRAGQGTVLKRHTRVGQIHDAVDIQGGATEAYVLRRQRSRARYPVMIAKDDDTGERSTGGSIQRELGAGSRR